jgi:hypothetical protein
VNAPVAVIVPESEFLMTIFFDPAAPAGVTAVIEVEDSQTTLVAATPPKVTVGVSKLVPVILTAVPPAVVPLAGLIEEKAGDEAATALSIGVKIPIKRFNAEVTVMNNLRCVCSCLFISRAPTYGR